MELLKEPRPLDRVLRLDVRVVGGATVDLEPYVAAHEASEFGCFYRLLAGRPILRTRTLEIQARRMLDLLAERLASHVLSRKDGDGTPTWGSHSHLGGGDRGAQSALLARRVP